MTTIQENTVVADRFRLVKMIGRGGMGSVWQATHIALDQPCAVKFIEGELANVAEAHARFEREAKAAAQLRSPHVVQIIDHGVWQGRPYIAMELLDGEDLGKALAKAGGKLAPGQVNTVIQQVCRALTKAHQAGIVHRDLKPDNIFLVNDDDRQLVKILDFGVAKQTSQALDGSNTKTGAMLGTPYYMSPEQAQGIKSVDSRSDLWSLAVIVYQCITGRLPFESEALGDLLVKIIVQPVPVPSSVASVPAGFDAWWAKAADRNPDARFPTAKDFGTALALALGTTAQDGIAPGKQLQHTALLQQGPSATGASPLHATGPHYQAPPQPFQQTPPPGMPHGLSQSNPATFSGVEPPMVVPKKGAPIGLIAGLVGIAVVGVAVGGYALTHRGGAATGSAPPPPTSIAAVSSPPPPPPPPVAIDPPETASAKTEPPPPVEPTVKPVAGHKPTAKPAPAPPPAPSASGKKKFDPGF